ncbi:(2Fe-2S)-binding protein [Clostridium carboxidivorans P7]|uniref:(2Fe-2S)-binding protein n=1 Tax=Clostridium TaxID=1485 RepID=UPI00064F7A4F|nr:MULTISPECIES: (2Fe-2S)-binding protein [Clostridium]AKN29803.1 (2Fe-2S)-binding protein [Clostridium carboxidivorans P7]WPC40307.1 (2Fe-2S)-binding protein [Clostridium sp. JS66]
MEQNLNEKIKDKLTKVCLCKAISRASIKNAINSGATSVEEVKKITGAGTGSCNGKRCEHKIQALIDQLTK